MLRVEVRHAADARRVPPAARPAPGVADGYLVGQGAAVTVSALTALISIHGTPVWYTSRPRRRWPGCFPWWRDGSVSGQKTPVIIDFNQY